jgi:prophage tail gpP-like protein
MVREVFPKFVEPFEVIVNGSAFSGFESLSIDRPLTAATGSFSLELHPDFRRGLPVLPGQSVQIVARDKTVISGFVDELDATSSRGSQTVNVSGRDKTADLVDCSTEAKQFTNATLLEIVETIVGPFGIGFAFRGINSTLFKYPNFQTNPGESAFSAIERAGRVQGALLYTRGDGALALDAPASGFSKFGIEEGPLGNVITSKLVVSNVDRFRTYVVRGQAVGDDFASGLESSAIEGFASDLAVDRFRPLIIVAPNNVSTETAESLAAWEATVRAARGVRVVVKLPGLRQNPADIESPFWNVNDTVRVKLPTLQVAGKLLINRVSIQRSRRKGTTTTLELVREDAYIQKPEIETEADAFSLLFENSTLELGD